MTDMTHQLLSLVTYSDLPQLDPDDRLLEQSLRMRGVEVIPAIWNDPKVEWSSHTASVIRSTWDYHLHYEEFLDWVDRVGASTTLFNSPSMVRWNSRKTYLAELENAGLPIVPTVFINKRDKITLEQILTEKNWVKAVIKPTVGLATSGVIKTDNSKAATEEGQRHVDKLLQISEVMVQEYMPSITDYGERSLMFIDGNYSHTVRKSAFQKLAVAGHAGESAAESNDDEIKIAVRILNYLDSTPLYARVDLVRDQHGESKLMELELCEPSMFLSFRPEAADELANAILRRI